MKNPDGFTEKLREIVARKNKIKKQQQEKEEEIAKKKKEKEQRDYDLAAKQFSGVCTAFIEIAHEHIDNEMDNGEIEIDLTARDMMLVRSVYSDSISHYKFETWRFWFDLKQQKFCQNHYQLGVLTFDPLVDSFEDTVLADTRSEDLTKRKRSNEKFYDSDQKMIEDIFNILAKHL